MIAKDFQLFIICDPNSERPKLGQCAVYQKIFHNIDVYSSSAGSMPLCSDVKYFHGNKFIGDSVSSLHPHSALTQMHSRARTLCGWQVQKRRVLSGEELFLGAHSEQVLTLDFLVWCVMKVWYGDKQPLGLLISWAGTLRNGLQKCQEQKWTEFTLQFTNF